MNAKLKSGMIVFILGLAVLASGAIGLGYTLVQVYANQSTDTLIQPTVQVGYVGSNTPVTIPQASQSFTDLSVVDSSGKAISYAQAQFTITVTLTTSDQTFSGTTSIQYSGSVTVSATTASTPISGSTQGTVSYSAPTFTYVTPWTQITAAQMFPASPADGAQSVITWSLTATVTLSTPTGTITKTASSSATFTATWKQDNTYAVSVSVTPSASTSTTTSTQTSTSTSTSVVPFTAGQISTYCFWWSPSQSVIVYLNGMYWGMAPASSSSNYCISPTAPPIKITLYGANSDGSSATCALVLNYMSIVRLSIFDMIQSPTVFPEFMLYIILIVIGASMMIMSVPMFLKRRR